MRKFFGIQWIFYKEKIYFTKLNFTENFLYPTEIDWKNKLKTNIIKPYLHVISNIYEGY